MKMALKIDYKSKRVLNQDEMTQELVNSYVAETASRINADIAVTSTALIKAKNTLKDCMTNYPWDSKAYLEAKMEVKGYEEALEALNEAKKELNLE